MNNLGWIIFAIIAGFLLGWGIRGMVIGMAHGDQTLANQFYDRLKLWNSHSSNVTLTMNEGDFTYCYKAVKKLDVSCNTLQLNQDRFKVMSDFLRFLDSGEIKHK